MTIETKLPFDTDFVSSFSKEAGEPAWLKAFRLNAIKKAETLPMPKPEKTKIDNWNFITRTGLTVKSNPYGSLDELPEGVKALINLESEGKNLYIQRNQTPAFLSLTDDLKKQGVIFTDLFTAAREHGDLLQKYLMTKAVKVEENRLTALHAALMNGGAFLYIPKNVEVTTPIQAVYVQDDPEASLINHVIVAAEENSSVTYVENYLSTVDSSNSHFNIISEVFAGANAGVQYGAVDNLTHGITTYANRRGYTERDARIEWALGLMNEGNTISENTTLLVGNGSSGHSKTVVVGTGDQTENFTTKVVHFGQNTKGYILKHGVVKDHSTVIFNGIGKIEHGASKADAEQESRLLMLSENARGDANPYLLIDEDDVMAGHAASVGRVDPEQLYYLMSRGITQPEAERLIIHGFLAPVVNQLPIEGVKRLLTEVIERKVRQ